VTWRKKEAAADAVLYRSAFGTAPNKRSGVLSALGLPNAFDTYLKNPANTNVVLWGNKLFALYEVTHPVCLCVCLSCLSACLQTPCMSVCT